MVSPLSFCHPLCENPCETFLLHVRMLSWRLFPNHQYYEDKSRWFFYSHGLYHAKRAKLRTASMVRLLFSDSSHLAGFSIHICFRNTQNELENFFRIADHFNTGFVWGHFDLTGIFFNVAVGSSQKFISAFSYH